MIDLEEQFNFTNKLKHPTNDRKAVYRYFDASQAEYFTELLVDADIEFEAQIDEDDPKKPTYFGVLKAYETKVDKLNFMAMGKGRDKFIPAALMRFIVFALSLLVILLAFLGYIVSE